MAGRETHIDDYPVPVRPGEMWAPDSIIVAEPHCRGDWGAPKSKASHAILAMNPSVIDSIHRLNTLTIEVRAGTAVGSYPAVRDALRKILSAHQ